MTIAPQRPAEFAAGSALYTRHDHSIRVYLERLEAGVKVACDLNLLAEARRVETLEGHGFADEARRIVTAEVDRRSFVRPDFAAWWLEANR